MLQGKVALITGGARGMGASHVRTLSKEGAKVVFTDILVEEGFRLEQELGPTVKFMRHDVSNSEAWTNIVAEAEKLFGPIDILVNNAGISIKGAIEEISVDDYMKVIQINQVGTLMGMKAVLPSMRKAGGGSIINISSILGKAGREESVAYVSSKFAINGITKTAALEFAKYHIRVNSVHPGSIRTVLTDLVYKTEEELAAREQHIPAGRFGQCEDVSNLVVYLASDKSAYSTGSEFVIDGGLLARI